MLLELQRSGGWRWVGLGDPWSPWQLRLDLTVNLPSPTGFSSCSVSVLNTFRTNGHAKLHLRGQCAFVCEQRELDFPRKKPSRCKAGDWMTATCKVRSIRVLNDCCVVRKLKWLKLIEIWISTKNQVIPRPRQSGPKGLVHIQQSVAYIYTETHFTCCNPSLCPYRPLRDRFWGDRLHRFTSRWLSSKVISVQNNVFTLRSLHCNSAETLSRRNTG